MFENLTTRRIVILLLVAAVVLLGWKVIALQRALRDTQEILLSAKDINVKVLDFTKLFIDRVLKAEGEISFDTRLQLENAVREIGDQTILGAWQKFVESENEVQAQNAVKDLLDALVKKIRVI